MNGLVICTKKCNLACSYCFESGHSNPHGFNVLGGVPHSFDIFLDEYFEGFLKQLIAVNKQLNRRNTVVTFHGGEPLLVGYQALEKAFHIAKRCDESVSLSIQTNGTLIDDSLVELFKRFDVSVGISIDGPAFLHDWYRVSQSGRGSFYRVMQSIELLKANNVPVGGLATVTSESARFARNVYDFFKRCSLDFTMNPCTCASSDEPTPGACDPESFSMFCKNLFDIWVSDSAKGEKPLSIGYFEDIINSLLVLDKPWMGNCNYIPNCNGTTIAIDSDGDLFRCLHYCSDKSNSLGNVRDVLIADVCDFDNGNNSRWDYLSDNDCKDCDIAGHCYGGCPYAAEVENGSIYSRPQTCRSHSEIVRYIHAYLMRFCKDESLGASFACENN